MLWGSLLIAHQGKKKKKANKQDCFALGLLICNVFYQIKQETLQNAQVDSSTPAPP